MQMCGIYGKVKKSEKKNFGKGYIYKNRVTPLGIEFTIVGCIIIILLGTRQRNNFIINQSLTK